ncbi:MAG: hypothetical protein QHH15_04900, partial [Candidatus Thermoplasmatota archaeon]|nr:hypothetical protein [Candidatus Thermoplasmatota archaeon]
ILTLIHVFDLWDPVIKALKSACDWIINLKNRVVEAVYAWEGWKKISDFLKKVWDILVKVVSKVWESIVAWRGWKEIHSFLIYTTNLLHDIVSALESIRIELFESYVSWEGWRKIANWLAPVIIALKELTTIIIFGKGQISETTKNLSFWQQALVNLLFPISLLANWLINIRKFFDEVSLAISKDKALMDELNAAWNELCSLGAVLWDSLSELFSVLSELSAAFLELFSVLIGSEPAWGGAKRGAEETSTPLSFLRVVVVLLSYFIRNVLIPAIRILIAIFRILAPVIRFVIDVIRVLIIIIQSLIYVFTRVKSAAISVQKTFQLVWYQIKSTVLGAIRTIINTLKGYVGTMKSVGRSLGKALWSGITSIFGIGSPAAAGIYLGRMIVAGIQKGTLISWSVLQKKFNAYVASTFEGIWSLFRRFRYQFYFGDMKSVAQTLADMAGNCYDVAQAAQYLLSRLGIPSSLFFTTWKGIAHVGLATPFGRYHMIGSGWQRMAGAPRPTEINVYIDKPTVADDRQIKELAEAISRKISESMKIGI